MWWNNDGFSKSGYTYVTFCGSIRIRIGGALKRCVSGVTFHHAMRVRIDGVGAARFRCNISPHHACKNYRELKRRILGVTFCPAVRVRVIES